MLFFGDPKLCPSMLKSADVPIGRVCLHCEKPITADDSGFLMAYAQAHATTIEAVHRACLLVDLLGDEVPL